LDKKQEQTQSTFAYKWSKTTTYESNEIEKNSYEWELDRYFGSEKERTKFFLENKGKSFLDAGCGSGFSAKILFNNELQNIKYTGVDISNAVWSVEDKLIPFSKKENLQFYQENIETMNLKEEFDVIFSEGVIHHTSNPFDTFKNLTKHLKTGGKMLFYVYSKKAPLREFTDDYIRNYIQDLSNDQSWEALLPLSELGNTLGNLNISIDIKENIDVLGIPKGTYNLQRLFYYYFAKAFYKEEYKIDEINHINFDWYRPSNCYRYESKEIYQWLDECNYKVERFIKEDSGITVVATKL